MLKMSSILRQIPLNFDYIIMSLSGEIKRSSSWYYFTSKTKLQNYSEVNDSNNAVITKALLYSGNVQYANVLASIIQFS